jgi:hypothetical protein
MPYKFEELHQTLHVVIKYLPQTVQQGTKAKAINVGRFQNCIVLLHCGRTCCCNSEHSGVLPSCLVTVCGQPQAEVKYNSSARGVEENCHGEYTALYGKTG